MRDLPHDCGTVDTYGISTRKCVVRFETECTVVPALGGPRRERPPAVYGHFVNVPTHFNVKLPLISGHLSNADADSHLLVVRTCYNGHCKQMPRFRWSFQPKNHWRAPKLGTDSSLLKVRQNANGTYDIEANTEIHRGLR